VGVELLLANDLLEKPNITKRVITWNAVDLLEAIGAWLVVYNLVSHKMKLLNEEPHSLWNDLLIEFWIEEFPARGLKVVIDAIASLCHILSKLVDEVSEHDRPLILKV
jgi:hypothetical protein